MELTVAGAKIKVDDNDIINKDTHTIGDAVNVFVKNYCDWELCPGIITGFAQNGSNMTAVSITLIKGGTSPTLETICLNDAGGDKYHIATSSTKAMMVSKEKMASILNDDLKTKRLRYEEALSRLEFYEKYINLLNNKEK